MELYKSKDYLNRKIKNYPVILFILVVAYFNLMMGAMVLILWLLIITLSNKRIIVSKDALVFAWPYFFNKREEYQWQSISKLVVNKKGYEGYGGAPYLEIYDNKTERKKKVSFDALDALDFELFINAVKQRVGEDNLDVISF